MFKISANLTENWIKLLNKEALLIPYAIAEDFIFSFDTQERVYTVQPNIDIVLAKQEKTVIVLDLFINFNHPLKIVDAAQENGDLVSFAQIITHTLMKNIETVEILNLSIDSI